VVLAWERKVMGEDFSYSLKEGCARRSLETLMDYQVQQGILDKKPDVNPVPRTYVRGFGAMPFRVQNNHPDPKIFGRWCLCSP